MFDILPLKALNLPVARGQRRWLGMAHAAAQSLVLKALADELSAGSAHELPAHASAASNVLQAPVVVLCQDSAQLQQIEAELIFFGARPFVFPDWETLPYDQLSPNQAIISERLQLLSNIPSQDIILLTAATALQRIAPPEWLLGQHFDFAVGDTLNVESYREKLIKAGYKAVDSVFEAGEFALRGALMDIYPTGQRAPLRLELFDSEIESIRLFDPESQRTLANDDGNPKKLDSFRVLPAHEYPIIEGRDTFRRRFAATFPEVSARKFSMHEDVMNGIAPQGLEYYLPLFFEKEHIDSSGHLFAYLPKGAHLVQMANMDTAIENFWRELERRHHDLGADIDHPILPPQELYMKPERLGELMAGFGRIVLSEVSVMSALGKMRTGAADLPFKPLPDVGVQHQQKDPLAALHQFMQQALNARLLFVSESAGRREILLDLLGSSFENVAQVADFKTFKKALLENDSPLASHTIAQIDRGVYLPDASGINGSSDAENSNLGEISTLTENAPSFAIITESQLFGRQITRTRARSSHAMSDEYLVKNITELTIGDPVVHIDHGIGRFAGLTMLTIDEEPDEFLQIKYADDASIYVPVANLQAISRYSGGDPDNAPLHRIGSDAWQKAKKKALEKIHDVAAELLDVQARRDARPGISFKPDELAYDLFASQFAFEETPDQLNAIEAVLFDMKQNKPMDRLVCGDVGFGKTEVAMRAAFTAVQAGYQVAVLVPTTLLAEQHEDNFKNRFADWPIRVEAVCRFTGKKKIEGILHAAHEGKVDILIGTHKLLQDDVRFANLGLMIVDEEHRFGVRHKEKIKSMRSDVDMLTLTATPIPRTLNMSLSGMRDLSIIATPPSRRLAIKTFVQRKTDALLKEAILREILRGGQVFYLHNDIASIERTAENVRELIPEARVAVAHGQMKGSQLERIMEDFYHKKHNVLVCTTIIETGIDIANANTIIIERADKFGLAQLHQLRGRVGRSHHQAYAYLLVPSVKGLKGDAKKRLDAIQRANTLGAGFLLASEDLEIRGAGELLGSEQSGNMQAIGFSLYMDMLKKATQAVKNGETLDVNQPLSITSDINLHLSALIPDAYLPDVHQRLLFYKRISSAESEGELIKLRYEMLDRFGLLPDATERLFAVHKIRLAADALKITKIEANASGARIAFSPNTPVDAMKIITLIQKQPSRYRMDGVHGLRIIDSEAFAEADKRIEAVKEFIETLKK